MKHWDNKAIISCLFNIVNSYPCSGLRSGSLLGALSFNIFARNSRTSISLKTGSISLNDLAFRTIACRRGSFKVAFGILPVGLLSAHNRLSIPFRHLDCLLVLNPIIREYCVINIRISIIVALPP